MEDKENFVDNSDICPVCGNKMIFSEGCATCPACGFSYCG